MSLLIVTSRYLKSGTAKTKSQRKNYTKYIATRESVEVREQSKKYSTENQKKLLNELLDDFPETKKYLEFEDYKNNPTVENASELISTIIERNADVIGNRQNFVGYMAMRPGVEKRGAHGLFNESNEPIVLDKIAEEVANHPGNVWSHVVSLRREDAIRLGYDNSDRWRELVMRHISDIAEQTKIPLCNLKWYGAFHDTTHHPHIHLIVYSTNPKQGFLTKQGIDKIRSVFANDIFHDELQSIYQEQTLRRDELKMESKKYVEQLVKQIAENHFHNANLENLVLTLKNQLDNTKGKKVYGYLKPEIKKTMDEIFRILSQDENISALYEKWCELERQKYKVYAQKEKEFPPLWENKVFQPVRNMIIRQVLNMNFTSTIIETDRIPDVDYDSEIIPSEDYIFNPLIPEEYLESEDISQNKYYIKWNDDHNAACTIIYDNNSNTDDFQEAEKLLLNCAESGNVLAMFELGKLYSMEKSGLKNDVKSFEYYQKALQGFLQIEPLAKKIKPYLQYQIGMMYSKGLGTPVDNQKAIEYLEKSAELGNQYAKRSLALEYISGGNITQDTQNGISLLTECADSGDAFSCCKLGCLYLFGIDGIKKDKEKAIEWLNKSAKQGNEYARNLLENMEQYQSEMLTNTVLGLFVNLSRCIADDYNQKFHSMRMSIDQKLRRMMHEKKQALGIKEDHSQQQYQLQSGVRHHAMGM